MRKRTKDKLIAILILLSLVGSGVVLGAVVSGVFWKIKESRLNHELRNLKKDLENLQKRLQKIEEGRIEVIATAYSSRRCETDNTPFITASNKKVRWGIIAMDKVPFGTKVYIPYFKKTFVVKEFFEIGFNPEYLLDCLKSIDYNTIEFYFTSELGPAMIKSPEDENYLYIVMPVKL